jgi:hypothetical protein
LEEERIDCGGFVGPEKNQQQNFRDGGGAAQRKRFVHRRN